MALKPYTTYECASGGVGGHSSIYTGASTTSAERNCCCGEPLVEVVSDGYRYKVVFETISPHQAAEIEARYGRGVWQTLTDAEWEALKWTSPVTSRDGTPNTLRDQYKRLLQDSQTHKQPIRNVHFFRSKESYWEEIAA